MVMIPPTYSTTGFVGDFLYHSLLTSNDTYVYVHICHLRRLEVQRKLCV